MITCLSGASRRGQGAGVVMSIARRSVHLLAAKSGRAMKSKSKTRPAHHWGMREQVMVVGSESSSGMMEWSGRRNEENIKIR